MSLTVFMKEAELKEVSFRARVYCFVLEHPYSSSRSIAGALGEDLNHVRKALDRIAGLGLIDGEVAKR